MGAGRRWQSRSPVEAGGRFLPLRVRYLGEGGVWGVALAALVLYVATLAPSVATIFDDALEFQVVIPLLGIPHPPGYPLYTLLGKGWILLVPLNDPAWRLNLLSAVAGGLALGLLGQATWRVVPDRRAVGIALALFALSPTFWGQATLAEVYTLHALFLAGVLGGLLTWMTAGGSSRALYSVAVFLGLGLAHHRLILLMVPVIGVALLLHRDAWPRQAHFWGRWLALMLAPLLLYAYLPLVGARVGSLDGTYVNTWQGFWDWVLARAYRVFLTDNPFNVQRNVGDYLRLYVTEMGLPAAGLALVGLIRWCRVPRVGLTLILTLALYAAFAFVYKVPDIEVFFLSAVMVSVPFVAAGWNVVHYGVARGMRKLPWRYPRVMTGLVTLLLAVVVMAPVLRDRWIAWETLNRSDDWAVYDYGLDIVQQPLPPGSTVVGILGETTLVRYFRDVLGYRPDLQVKPADREEERHAAIAALLAAGRPVFITRPLAGAAERYSLDAVGPLIRVWPKGKDDRPAPTVVVNESFTPAITLAGYDVRWRQTHMGPTVRLTLYWDVQRVPATEYKVSARLVRSDGSVAVAVDSVPVHNTYPTPFWQPGERVVDVYDLGYPRAAASEVREVVVILYRAADGGEVYRFTFPLPPRPVEKR